MTLIKINNSKDIIPIYTLWRLVLNFIYKPEELKPSQIDSMFASINKYKKNFQWARDNGIMFTAVEEEVENVISNIDDIIEKDATGLLDIRKKNFKEKNIDYRKFHRLPEAFKAEDFIRGQRALNEHEKNNPEDYE